jgi:ubiquinone/menaquinone biosynthesis C-methylase UbiE
MEDFMSFHFIEREDEFYNRVFYDAVADVYKEADGRRVEAPWIVGIVKALAHKRSSLLEIGAGTGFLSNIAVDYFPRVVAVDISPKMLEKITDPRIEKVCCSGYNLPFEDNEFDVVAVFSTLHHIADQGMFLEEAARVLSPSGMLYSDHDLDRQFYDRFKQLIRLYRMLRRPAARYAKLSGSPSAQLSTAYEQSECWDRGVLVGGVLACLSTHFRNVNVTYHWGGLTPFRWLDTFFSYRAGFNPLVRIIAWGKK